MKRLWIMWLLAVVAVVLGGLFSLKGRPMALLVMTPNQYGQWLYQHEQFEEAATWFPSADRKGAALYRAGNFKEASMQLMGDTSAEGIYNLGNALAMQGKYEDAAAAYKRALAAQPNWPEAEENLEIARQSAARLEKKGGNMTGGEMGADDYTFSKSPKRDSGGFEEQESGGESSAMQAIWLRQVQTRPADFLRSKFAYQVAMEESPTEGK